MIDTTVLDREFEGIIQKRAVFERLGITSNFLRWLRYKTKNNMPIRIETKMKLLQRYGYRTEAGPRYTERDLMEAMQFYAQTSQAARDMGVDYVLQKFLLHRGQG